MPTCTPLKIRPSAGARSSIFAACLRPELAAAAATTAGRVLCHSRQVSPAARAVRPDLPCAMPSQRRVPAPGARTNGCHFQAVGDGSGTRVRPPAYIAASSVRMTKTRAHRGTLAADQTPQTTLLHAHHPSQTMDHSQTYCRTTTATRQCRCWHHGRRPAASSDSRSHCPRMPLGGSTTFAELAAPLARSGPGGPHHARRAALAQLCHSSTRHHETGAWGTCGRPWQPLGCPARKSAPRQRRCPSPAA